MYLLPLFQSRLFSPLISLSCHYFITPSFLDFLRLIHAMFSLADFRALRHTLRQLLYFRLFIMPLISFRHFHY